jgi:3-dehydroquinate dehydratase/shikimate dehydrogenase
MCPACAKESEGQTLMNATAIMAHWIGALNLRIVSLIVVIASLVKSFFREPNCSSISGSGTGRENSQTPGQKTREKAHTGARYATGMACPELETARLRLCDWREADREPFITMNGDPLVMRHFLSTLTARETAAMIERNRVHFERHGFGLWAAEIRATGEFAGFIGLAVPTFEAHFTPCVEVGWRLAPRFWNQGLATEGAAEVLRFAFEDLQLVEIVSFTSTVNLASQRVMQKIGMRRNPADDFDHPRIPTEHPLCRHVLYRVGRPIVGR